MRYHLKYKKRRIQNQEHLNKKISNKLTLIIKNIKFKNFKHPSLTDKRNFSNSKTFSFFFFFCCIKRVYSKEPKKMITWMEAKCPSIETC